MKRILIIRFSSIGDIVLTTPVVRCLKRQLGNVEVHYLTKEKFLPVIVANPYIDKILTIKEKIGEVIPELKKNSYDFIIDLHKNFRSKGVIMKLRKPAGSFPKLNIKKWLTVNFKINHLPDIHIVDRYFKAVESLGVTNDRQGLDYFIPAGDEIDAGILPETHRNGYIGWVIGGTYFTKIFPDEKIIEVCRKINKPVVLLGGKEDEKRGQRIAELTGENIFNACGRFNLNGSASLVKQAEMIVTNDTGLMHIAAAFRKEIISLWGNTIPAFGMYPYMPGNEDRSVIIEVNNLSCRPCSKLGYGQCPKKHFKCMQEIDINRIIELLS